MIKDIEYVVLFSVHFLLSLPIFSLINRVQPTPLIDEIYHVPQGIKYCSGNFSQWDPKITTLPGLYIISFGVLQAVQFLTQSSLCSIYYFRLLNVLCSSVTFITFYSITKLLLNTGKENNKKSIALWTAFNLSVFPVSFLFNFVYYTETMSTFFVILMWRLHLSKKYWLAATVGVCSVLMRQVNIIWVGFMLLDLIIKLLKYIRNGISHNSIDLKFIHLVSRHLYDHKKKWKIHFYSFFQDTSGYLLVCFLFLLFLFVNKGIVVGDRNSHTPVLHVCQIFYFALFTLIFAFFHFVKELSGFRILVETHKIYFISFIFIGSFIVLNNTLVHPYLLADNRHYSFYMWKRLYEKHALCRYAFIPVYFFGLYAINSSVKSNIKIPFWICAIISLVPQKLLEFRYFILPFILFRLNIVCKSYWQMFVETIFFLTLNFFVIYIFVTKEFYWTDSNEIQRIIW